MSEATSLERFVRIRSGFMRSVHVERDFLSKTTGYLMTECGASAMATVRQALTSPSQRALSITGPYGAGKSAFCMHLAQEFVEQRGKQVRLQPVLIVGSRRPLAAALVSGLERALLTLGDAGECLRKSVQDLGETPEPRALANLFLAVSAAVCQEGTRDGLLLVIDEMGKFLEYAALNPERGDVFVLQEMAEAAVRSPQVNPLLIVSVLHQSADTYARGLGPTQQAEWAKIGERYQSIPFFPSDRERLDIVGKALEHDQRLETYPGLRDLRDIARACADANLTPSGMDETFPSIAVRSYPIHPIALLALPPLFKRSGQSHRSVFNFLAGEEANALGRFLRETPFTPSPLPVYTLDRLYDYAAEQLAWTGSMALQWAEVSEAVEHAGNISPLAVRALKCIGLLRLIKSPRLSATDQVLRLALDDGASSHENLQAALAELQRRKLIVFSRMRQTYRLWEGGDVDVEAEIERAASTLGRDVSLLAAQDLCPPMPVIARRHSYKTGTLRAVMPDTCSASSLGAMLENSPSHQRIIFCLAQSAEDVASAQSMARACNDVSTLVAVTLETEMLRQAALSIAAASLVERQTVELAHDRAARRELAERRHEAESAFRTEWARLFRPGCAGTSWWWRGLELAIPDRRGLSTLLSEMADAVYSSAPCLRNELINRPSLSSAAAAGRRNLIEGMLLKGHDSRLGMAGFPPEASMYECLLGASGLHQKDKEGKWGFGEPTNEATRLQGVWEAFSLLIFTDLPQILPVTEVWSVLQSPPYGLTEGVLPVLLCAFLIAHRNETTMYREGTFLPEPHIADWELLLRRPELFAVAGCRVTGARLTIVERLGRGLNAEPAVVPVVRALIRNVRSLSEYARKTRNLPETVLAMREAFEKPRSPERLLFVDLPTALKVALPEGAPVTDENVEAFFKALNGALQSWSEALPDLLRRARADLLTACGHSVDDSGWDALTDQCRELQGRTAHPLLNAFVHRLVSSEGSSSLESVLALLADRPPRTWSDPDYNRFLAQARTVGALLHQMNAPRPASPAHDLTPQELRKSKALASTLFTEHGQEPRILRAALAMLFSRIETETHTKGPHR